MTPDPGYEAAKRIAAEGTEAERIALASLPDVAPEILYFLANDGQLRVRAAVAANAATPAQADSLLAGDDDPRVRAVVGRKLAPRAPELAAATDRLRALAWKTLCQLAADTAVMVRAVIAEELQALPGAPRDLILRLAQDAAMEVAAPVIRFSPQLTEDDLLALVERPPVPETVTAVARRPRLSERISDAVAARAETAPVAALLTNDSAAIRERTLDTLIAQAASRPEWQESLVRRAGLSHRATLALAAVVADHLLEPLASRADLDPGLARLLRARMDLRLGRGDAAAALPPDLAFEEAGLQGDHGMMQRLLAEHAGVPLRAVEHVAQLRSGKALVSLCWRAGFSPRAALAAQTVLGRIAPAAVIAPTAKGGWPLTEAEMRWQIELLNEPEEAR
ncbi:DUF2336 domain-containing protein [Paracraurococcus lichenis]|uniref:DUF2336 domain-containing protein n=1 Tax=Paracraurococcus lichenis TaxID=3064888 RepID=A0ABT9E7A0_9PROT|nr:DUF2336 domain-containing protein [Paracraurococcus sp. LOR1-02]MDO9712021.1 DUF2336 domain-containing protein [Paracraurococcus sp. LOR1-02]